VSRLVFANQLRALAVPLVMINHWVGLYWLDTPLVAAATFSPEIVAVAPDWVHAVIGGGPWNFGPLGVAIFFLISGFVIPMSLDHHTRLGFMRARLLRIYPTYILALLIQLAVVCAAARHWGIGFDISLRKIVANALLIQGLMHTGSLDLVNWTLVVELIFYALATLLARHLRERLVWPLAGVALAAALLNAGFSALIRFDPGFALAPAMKTGGTYASCISFMLIGTLFTYHLRGRLSTPRLLAAVAAGVVLFWSGWAFGVNPEQYPNTPGNYAAALMIFAVAYALRRSFRPNRLIDFVAAISFPLYLVHSLIGYAAMTFLMRTGGLAYEAALVLAFILVVLIAQGLHMTVELWSIRAGKPPARAGGVA
jgi:peptidoglycan/LPS O-acetylase OafA/YrhL